ncbi:hypothetical protein HQ325_02870 [Rhodococcus sp. BP-349]|uniref:hypothetical protein n=1 Tax=unclassified Rhodococcus (in: high G+C Gram-positive bacteria) TaxID=192944 RepID=UPI001C9A84AA|nr:MULTISPECIES: hypothetical protein [unclassified Rhodococcus (in: high G+C Gram-positive bacteria)]MBY6537606.1 hypothetical protein [Rhodococcus sp. BP-363]MBY6541943.1 hypothetical protein [Rhodococcus sp. BP-369]MBY6561173.1 hypothetical protein [Rhodococcus sp. BP-370]MBY6575465.1 hypothetical protein [Rhodococcus sp. BP-364]MBY6584766.1 hypothetical protein [Rhodococcus sp. BP-358]
MNAPTRSPSPAELKTALFTRFDHNTAAAYLHAVAAESDRTRRRANIISVAIAVVAAAAGLVSVSWFFLGNPEPGALAALTAVAVFAFIANALVLIWSRNAPVTTMINAQRDVAIARNGGRPIWSRGMYAAPPARRRFSHDGGGGGYFAGGYSGDGGSNCGDGGSSGGGDGGC